MANNSAYTFTINPVGSGKDENDSVHQSSPSWVLTFARWENRDTFKIKNVGFKEVRDPLVVQNDCIQLTTGNSKGSLTPSMSATLLMSDVNYETAVAPGDFVFVNILDWQDDADRVAQKATNKQSINEERDGFKGIFKIQSVRKIVNVDPNTGTVIVLFRITGFAFTELNNTIYFNPYMLDPNRDKENLLLFSSHIGKDWANFVNDKGLTRLQDIISFLIQSFIGNGISDEGRLDKQGNVISPNVHFFIPELVGKLLGIKGAKAAKDIYDGIFGIQKYASGSSQKLSDGMNPSGLRSKFGRISYTPISCQGDTLLKPEYWNQVKAWSIINQFTNAPLNELYTCFKISKSGRVMPTLVFRQMPFTHEDFKGGSPVTKFMNLPRWKINPAMILTKDLGREEAARINFVQMFGSSTVSTNGAGISTQIAQTNYDYDSNDVLRSGLRPYIVNTQFDELTTDKKEYLSPQWAKILGDALIGGHLKMNGTITCAGIVDPIAVGDNLEDDGIVYHIEQVSHTCNINVSNGEKTFRTSIALSNGMHIDSGSSGRVYPEMSYTNANDLREEDSKNDAILPGVSDSQDITSRGQNIDNVNKKNDPFPQPNSTKRKIKRSK